MYEKDGNRWCAVLGVTALCVALLCTPVWAAERMRPLDWVHVDGMSFVSGGVGMHERRELFNLVRRYDVLMSFAGQEHGGFLTDVRVELSRQGREQHVALYSAGPYMFAQLPPGQYELTASAPGRYSSHYHFEALPYHHGRIFVTLRKRPKDEQVVSMR